MNEKLPFMLKRGPVTEAIKKGIMFELCYSSSIYGKIMLLFSFQILSPEDLHSQMQFKSLKLPKEKILSYLVDVKIHFIIEGHTMLFACIFFILGW